MQKFGSVNKKVGYHLSKFDLRLRKIWNIWKSLDDFALPVLFKITNIFITWSNYYYISIYTRNAHTQFREGRSQTNPFLDMIWGKNIFYANAQKPFQISDIFFFLILLIRNWIRLLVNIISRIIVAQRSPSLSATSTFG